MKSKHTMTDKQRIPLNVLIIGAGLGGLGAAICLARKGHIVTVLEVTPQLDEVGAGIQIPPNSTRILDSYGLRTKLSGAISLPKDIIYRRYSKSEVLSSTPLQPMETENGNPYWLIHRADFRRVLYNAAMEEGASILLGASVVHVDEQAPAAVLKDGRRMDADLIIGADGIHSNTRKVVISKKGAGMKHCTSYAYRFTVPAALMDTDNDLKRLMDDVNVNCWLGPGGHVIGYPIRQGSVYNVVLPHCGEGQFNRSSEPGNVEEMKAQYAKFDPIVSKLLTRTSECLKWKLEDLAPLSNWISESGKVVLIGDAAHAMFPYLAQGAAMAIEDGAALGECLDRARSNNDIPRVLRAFESIRKPRCERLQMIARRLDTLWHLPDGKRQRARDKAMRPVGRTRQNRHPNPNKIADTKYRSWMFEHDVFESINRTLDKILGR